MLSSGDRIRNCCNGRYPRNAATLATKTVNSVNHGLVTWTLYLTHFPFSSASHVGLTARAIIHRSQPLTLATCPLSFDFPLPVCYLFIRGGLSKSVTPKTMIHHTNNCFHIQGWSESSGDTIYLAPEMKPAQE